MSKLQFVWTTFPGLRLLDTIISDSHAPFSSQTGRCGSIASLDPSMLRVAEAAGELY